MSKKRFKNIYIYCLLFLLTFSNVYAQSIPQGFNYKTIVRDGSGVVQSNQSVLIRFSLYSNSATGILQWQEDHSLITDVHGLAKAVIGNGSNTGAGAVSSFNLVNWSSGVYYLKASVDITGAGYIDMSPAQLFSVPYSLYSLSSRSANNLALGQLNDISLTGLAVTNTIKWNGVQWYPALDDHSDTVLFSYTSLHSEYTDTALYVLNSALPDSVLFAYNTLNSPYSFLSGNSNNSNQSVYSDTASYAFSFSNSFWNLSGITQGASPDYFGTNDFTSLDFKINNVLQLQLDNTGNFLIGNSVNPGRLSLSGNDGLVASGTFGTGVSSGLGTGTSMMWLPSTASFRVGGVSALYADSLGIYSVSSGYNNRAGKYSFVSGNTCVAGDYTIAMGRKSEARARGAYPNGSGVALGDSCLSTDKRCLAIGRGNLAGLSSTVAIGNYTKSTGAVALALGTNCNANGNYSSVLGYYASANLKQGVFVYSDASSNSFTVPAINNQFVVRASGGTIFYTDPNRTMGVTLFAGSGSWASISDRNKKENIKIVDYSDVLNKIEKLKITSWNYKSQSNQIRHVGPMAQDFYAFYELGENNTTISNIDMDGVTFAGIKDLNFRIKKLNTVFADIDYIKKSIDESKDKSAELNKRLDVIEASLKSEHK